MMYLPSELVEKILKYVDGRTLLSANDVCQQWRAVITQLSKVHNLWKNHFDRDIPSGIQHQISSKYCGEYLEKDWNYWYTLYANVEKWRKVMRNQEMDVTVSPIGTNAPASDSQVYRVRCGGSGMRLCRHKDTMYLTNSDGEEYHKIIDDVAQAELIGPNCFIVTCSQCVYSWTWGNSCDEYIEPPTFLATWYGPDKILAIDYYRNEPYFLTEAGKILELAKYEPMLVSKSGIKMPVFGSLQQICFRNGLVVGLLENGEVYVSIGASVDHTVSYDFSEKVGSKPTAVLLHCNMIILGFSSGMVYWYGYDRDEDLLALDLMNFRSINCAKNISVSSLDIRELDDHQEIVVRCENDNLFSIKFKTVEPR